MKIGVLLDGTFRVVPINGEWQNVVGIKNNGQHYQLPGHVLVEYRMNKPLEVLYLMHPDTTEETGHYDVAVRFPGDSVEFRRYNYQELSLLNAQALRTVWPQAKDSLISTDSAWEIIQVVCAVEDYLYHKVGREPKLKKHIVHAITKSSICIEEPQPA